MAEETTISTPEVTSDTETSSEELNSTNELQPSEELNTSELEPDSDSKTAETETKTGEPKLYAGKYSSIEELEKGYGELNKAFTQANQIKAKYEELQKKLESENSLKLEEARKAGYNTIDEQQIDNNVKMAEFNAFWSNLTGLNPDVQPEVQQYLTDYYRTGNTDFLKAAKTYFSADFLERVAVGKLQLQEQLQQELNSKYTQEKNRRDAELADVIKGEFAEFLSDVNENTGKAKALKAFCDANFIQSKDDMQIFTDIYGEMENYIKSNAIKEYEAQKAIATTKQKATITADNGSVLDANTGIPSAEAMRNDAKLYAKAVKKFGMDKVDEILMKG